MSIENLKANLSVQVAKNAAPIEYTTLYYQEQGELRSHLYVEGVKHFCGIEECPSNDS